MRIYRGGEAVAATFLYIHGGGWVGRSIDLLDRSARGLAFMDVILNPKAIGNLIRVRELI